MAAVEVATAVPVWTPVAAMVTLKEAVAVVTVAVATVGVVATVVALAGLPQAWLLAAQRAAAVAVLMVMVGFRSGWRVLSLQPPCPSCRDRW